MTRLDSTADAPRSDKARFVACLVLVIGTLATMVSIDLVLPAIPMLPSLLGGDAQAAQYVLATYMGGSSVGLILFGAIAHRVDARRLLGWSLVAYAIVSGLAAFATDIWTLNAIRVVQGATSAGAAVLPNRTPTVRTEVNSFQFIRLPIFGTVTNAFSLPQSGEIPNRNPAHSALRL